MQVINEEAMKRAELITNLLCYENRANLMFATGQTRNKIDEIYDDDDLSEEFKNILTMYFCDDTKEELLLRMHDSRVVFVLLGVLYEKDILLDKELFNSKLYDVVKTCIKLSLVGALKQTFKLYDELFVYDDDEDDESARLITTKPTKQVVSILKNKTH